MKTPPRDPCKRTCKQWPWTANPFGGGRSWALLWQSLGAVVRSWDVTIYIYIYKSFLLGLTVLSLHVRCFPHQQFDKTFLSKCVCVDHLNRCKTSYMQGATLPVTREWPTKSLVSGTENVPAFAVHGRRRAQLGGNYIYIYICT